MLPSGAWRSGVSMYCDSDWKKKLVSRAANLIEKKNISPVNVLTSSFACFSYSGRGFARSCLMGVMLCGY